MCREPGTARKDGYISSPGIRINDMCEPVYRCSVLCDHKHCSSRAWQNPTGATGCEPVAECELLDQMGEGT